MDALFECNQCGACCRLINLSEETLFLDRGDGTCRYLDDLKKTCTIYDRRPDICNVRVMYEHRYSKQFSWTHFIQLNKSACNTLSDITQV
jgi:uncharacterized protein